MKKAYTVSVFLLCLLVLAISVLLLVKKHEIVESAYSGRFPAWLDIVRKWVYPRFDAEKSRLPADFFVEKINQLALRGMLVSGGCVIFFFLYRQSQKFREKLSSFTEVKTSADNVNALRVLFYLMLVIISRNVYEDLRALENLELFYAPVQILKVFHLPYPPKQISFMIYAMIFLSSFLVVFSIRPILFSALAAAGFIIYQAYLYSFEKVDHGYATFTYALMLMPFLLGERDTAKKHQSEYFSSWALRLIHVVICCAYFLSGLEKLLISGLGWISPETFRTYLFLHNTPAGLWVAGNQLLVYVLPVLALLFQLTFPVMLFIPRLIIPLVIAGGIFHISAVIFFGISSFENPWMMVYIFFFDWSWLGHYIRPLPGYFKR
jgi:hypothetical protein